MLDLKFHEIWVCEEHLDESTAAACVASDLLKVLAIPSDTTERRCTVEQEDLKV